MMPDRFSIPHREVERFDPADLRRYLTDPVFKAECEAQRRDREERNNIEIDRARLKWAEGRGLDHYWVRETRARVEAYDREHAS